MYNYLVESISIPHIDRFLRSTSINEMKTRFILLMVISILTSTTKLIQVFVYKEQF